MSIRSFFQMFFGIFFPSWKFFDEVSQFPQLFLRFGPSENGLGNWQRLNSRPPRRFWLNGFDNLAHAQDTLIERLFLESNQTGSTSGVAQISYDLVERLVQQEVQSLSATAVCFQFKICLWTAHNQQHSDALISAVHGTQR